ncbi:MAG: L,D-transpeptidase family protein [Hyphomicrobiales bacterium]|nr:L,D-transpeptidase family protein [Hyphomicrobiales bacterium]
MDLLLPQPLTVLIAGLLALLVWAPAQAEGKTLHRDAKQLILVTPDGFNAASASLQTFEKAEGGQDWKPVMKPARVVAGVKGFAWGWDQDIPSIGETGSRDTQTPALRKREGDKRTPMGVYRLGRPFGFGEDTRADYMRLSAGKTFCVDDVNAPEYGKIVDRAGLPKKVSAENMGVIPLYRKGFIVEFPENRDKKSGSCIFLHLWRGQKQGTVGCVAMDEKTMGKLQKWVRPGAVIAILPPSATHLVGLRPTPVQTCAAPTGEHPACKPEEHPWQY